MTKIVHRYKSALIASLVIIVAFGLFVPVGSYSTTNGCRSAQMPISRLHMIAGDSLREVRLLDDSVDYGVGIESNGCSLNTKYVLYLL